MNDLVYICDHVRDVIELHFDVLNESLYAKPIIQQLEAFSAILFSAHQSGDPRSAIEISNGHPNWLGKSSEEIMSAALTLQDAQLAVARIYGFEHWDQAIKKGANVPEMEFELAVDELIYGEVGALRRRIEQNPGLVKAKSAYPHQATLLHYIAANGVEIWRQVVSYDAVEAARVLIDAGADIHASMNVYGGAYKTLPLLQTSAHPAKAGIASQLEKLLL